VSRPVEQLQGETGDRLAPAEHDDRALLGLVTVASRTMEHADAVVIEEPVHVGELVDHASGENHAQGDDLLVAHPDDEATPFVAPRRRRCTVTEHDAGIAAQLRPRAGEQRHGIGRVAAEIAMGPRRPAVAVLTTVDHEYRTPVTRQPRRRAQAGGTPSHHDGVIHPGRDLPVTHRDHSHHSLPQLHGDIRTHTRRAEVLDIGYLEVVDPLGRWSALVREEPGPGTRQDSKHPAGRSGSAVEPYRTDLTAE